MCDPPPLCHPAENMHLLARECRKDLVVPLGLSHSRELNFLSLGLVTKMTITDLPIP